VILEEAPASVPAEGEGEAGSERSDSLAETLASSLPLSLSAKSRPALAEAAGRLATHLKENADLDPLDVAYSLATTRSAFEHRAIAQGADREELIAALASIAAGEPSPGTLLATAREGKLAYLLTGQGSQRLGMGRELHESDAGFRAAFDAACAALDPHLQTP